MAAIFNIYMYLLAIGIAGMAVHYIWTVICAMIDAIEEMLRQRKKAPRVSHTWRVHHR